VARARLARIADRQHFARIQSDLFDIGAHRRRPDEPLRRHPSRRIAELEQASTPWRASWRRWRNSSCRRPARRRRTCTWHAPSAAVPRWLIVALRDESSIAYLNRLSTFSSSPRATRI